MAKISNKTDSSKNETFGMGRGLEAMETELSILNGERPVTTLKNGKYLTLDKEKNNFVITFMLERELFVMPKDEIEVPW